VKLYTFSWDNIFSLGTGEVSLDERGLVLVTGENQDEGGANGAGKSSLASKGIIWTLYGQTAGGLKADAVVNRHTKKKSGWGSIGFISEDGQEYIVRRERPAKLRLWRGADEITAKKSSETQALIDLALGRDYKTFIQTEMFGQGRNLSYASLPGAEQKRVLEQILPFQALDQWGEEAKEKAKAVGKKVDEANTQHQVAIGQLNVLQDQHDTVKGKRAEWHKQHEQELAALKDKIDKLQPKPSSVGPQIQKIQQQIDAIPVVTTDHLNVASDAIDKAEEVKTEAADLYKKAIEAARGWEHLKIQRAGKVRTPPENMICPVCDRELEFDVQDRLRAEYEEHRRVYEEAKINWEEAEKVVVAYTEHLVECKDRVVAAKCHLENLRSSYNAVRDLTIQRDKLRLASSNDDKEFSLIRARLQADYDNQMLTPNPWTEQMDALSSQLKTHRTEVSTLREKVEVLESEHADLLYWQQAYAKDMKLKLFAAACPYLDQQTAGHLRDLANPQLHVQFSTVKILSSGEGKEDFNVRCWNDTGGEGFDSLSGGEQQIVSFAIGRSLADLARSQTSGGSGFQILDEPFSMLDERNSEAIVNYLKGAQTEGTVLLISNEDQLKGLIDNRISVIKRNGISEVA
jgi:DNA repair exonuclease SbcCD ATPase subunit